jgi:SpoVK/Ycf46/Vps4 family AAA+-type ATPase
MLPGKPKIFHGRDLEVKEIVETLHQEKARIAILGPGGMGKTSLAKAVLHHPAIVTKYQHRFFITSDSAATSIELVALIGSHIGLKPGKDLTKQLVQYFATSSSCLLIVDNLETVWDPIDSRSQVEEFLSILTDIPHLDLIVGII